MKNKSQAIQRAPRDSNMELLRIVAMAFVVLVHTDFWALGAPTPELITTEPSKAFMQYVVEAISIVSVNCFVFISGWFGIKPKWRSFCGLLFQIVFFSLFIYFAFVAVGKEPFSISSFINRVNFLDLWFIPPYIALYWLSPIINTFIEKADKKVVVQVLIAFVILDISLGWMKDYLHFNMGYSLLNFMLLYLIARYLHLFKPVFMLYKKKYYLLLYFSVCSFLVAINYLAFAINHGFIKHTGFLFFYNSPFVLLASLSICLFFTKLKIQNKWINKIGLSCFAIYLFHMNPIIKNIFKNICLDCFNNYNIFFHSCLMVILVIAIFIIATALDQIRIYLYNQINKIAN